MNKAETLDRFYNFKRLQSYPYARAYFTDEVALILRKSNYIMQMAKVERQLLTEYCDISVYEEILDLKKIEKNELLILIVIRHFDMYIEYLLEENGTQIKHTLKNKPFEKSLENKFSELNEYVFIKGVLQDANDVFEKSEYEKIQNFRNMVYGSWIGDNLKIYFKEKNRLVYIVNDSVLFGKYYFLYNYVNLMLENANEFRMSDSLYYEIEINESNQLVLSNQNYGQYIKLEKLESK